MPSLALGNSSGMESVPRQPTKFYHERNTNSCYRCFSEMLEGQANLMRRNALGCGSMMPVDAKADSFDTMDILKRKQTENDTSID